MINLGSLFQDVAGPLASGAGDALLAHAKDERQRLADAIAQHIQDREDKHQALLDAVEVRRAGGTWGHLQPGEDENGPGMFQENSATGAVRRATVGKPSASTPTRSVPAVVRDSTVGMAGVGDSQDMTGGGAQEPQDTSGIVQRGLRAAGLPPQAIGGLRPFVRPSAVSVAAPRTINTDKGIQQWDPATHTFKPTGMNAPARQPPPGAEPTDVRDNRRAAERDMSALHDTRSALRDAGKSLGPLSTSADSARVLPLIKSLQQRSDSIQSEYDRHAAAANPAASASSVHRNPAGTPSDLQSELVNARQAFEASLARPGADTARSQALYQQIVRAIRQKHGAP